MYFRIVRNIRVLTKVASLVSESKATDELAPDSKTVSYEFLIVAAGKKLVLSIVISSNSI